MKLKDYKKLPNFPKDKIISTEPDNLVVVVQRAGERVELHGPFCDMCGAHMGEEYRPYAKSTKAWTNPHKHESYGDNTCPMCGQQYFYEEGDQMRLSEKDLIALRKLRKLA